MKRSPIRPRRREPRTRSAPRWTWPEWEAANLTLYDRAEYGACEICGHRDMSMERHHRKRRRDGGDRLSNILLLCTACHRHVTEHPSEARRYGWIVSVSRDPSQIPVLWRRKEWVLLDDDGNRNPLHGSEIQDAHD